MAERRKFTRRFSESRKSQYPSLSNLPEYVRLTERDLDDMQDDPRPWHLTKAEARNLRVVMSRTDTWTTDPVEYGGRFVTFIYEEAQQGEGRD